MTIRSAQFIKSSASIEQCPDSRLPEYAFIGRSNVGKSSLINYLTGQKGLAKTSQKPGKTQLINHFLINDAWYIVDLPGYGYASRGKSQREAFGNMIMDYTARREQLTCLFILIDSRLEPQRIDLDFINRMGEMGVPFCIIFTKADKVGINALKSSLQLYQERLQEDWEELPPIFVSSANKGMGKEEILSYIEEVNSTL